MSATKANLLTRLPETAIIAALAGMCGYLIHEAGNEATVTARIDGLETRVSELESLHPRIP